MTEIVGQNDVGVKLEKVMILPNARSLISARVLARCQRADTALFTKQKIDGGMRCGCSFFRIALWVFR